MLGGFILFSDQEKLELKTQKRYGKSHWSVKSIFRGLKILAAHVCRQDADYRL
jgi:hypothetical protein